MKNRLLKDRLKKANIPYDEVNPFEEKIENTEKFDPDQGGRIVNPLYITEKMKKGLKVLLYVGSAVLLFLCLILFNYLF